MEIFVSKSKVIKVILFGTIKTFAALFVAVKVFYIFFLANRSVLNSPFDFQFVLIIAGSIAVSSIFIFGIITIIIFSRLYASELQLIINTKGTKEKRLVFGLIE